MPAGLNQHRGIVFNIAEGGNDRPSSGVILARRAARRVAVSTTGCQNAVDLVDQQPRPAIGHFHLPRRRRMEPVSAMSSSRRTLPGPGDLGPEINLDGGAREVLHRAMLDILVQRRHIADLRLVAHHQAVEGELA